MDQSRRKASDMNYNTTKKKEKRKSRYLGCQTSDWNQYQPVSEFSAGHWNSQGQRLYPTMSDSAVCSYPYPVPYDCPMGTGFPIYPVLSTNLLPISIDHHRPNRVRRKNNDKYVDTDGSINSNTVFTSLPPVNIGDMSCGEKRRFSDPGLNNVDESNESSFSESVSDSCSISNGSLMEHVSELKSENKRLNSELESTKNELKNLKTEFIIISNKLSCHEPISLAQMVKEIRDAAEIREKVLLSKVEVIVDKSVESKSRVDNDTEINSLRKRVSQLECHLESLRIHSKLDNSKVNGGASNEEIEIGAKQTHGLLHLRPKSCIAENTKDGELYSGLRLHLNADNGESTSDCNGNSLSTVSYESLSTNLGPSSMSSATFTVCGPVTDL